MSASKTGSRVTDQPLSTSIEGCRQFLAEMIAAGLPEAEAADAMLRVALLTQLRLGSTPAVAAAIQRDEAYLLSTMDPIGRLAGFLGDPGGIRH